MKFLTKIILAALFGLLINMPVMNAEVDGGHGTQAKQDNHQATHVMPAKSIKKGINLFAGIATRSLQKIDNKIEGLSHVSSASIDDNLKKALLWYGVAILLEIIGAIFYIIFASSALYLIGYVLYFFGFLAWCLATYYFIMWLISVL